MEQHELRLYTVDIKYIRNLQNKDNRIYSVSPQIGKDDRPFLGILLVCNEHSRELENTANVLYEMYNSDKQFSARERCADFKNRACFGRRFSYTRK